MPVMRAQAVIQCLFGEGATVSATNGGSHVEVQLPRAFDTIVVDGEPLAVGRCLVVRVNMTPVGLTILGVCSVGVTEVRVPEERQRGGGRDSDARNARGRPATLPLGAH
jgi:hypothetical protein